MKENKINKIIENYLKEGNIFYFDSYKFNDESHFESKKDLEDFVKKISNILKSSKLGKYFDTNYTLITIDNPYGTLNKIGYFLKSNMIDRKSAGLTDLSFSFLEKSGLKSRNIQKERSYLSFTGISNKDGIYKDLEITYQELTSEIKSLINKVNDILL